MYKMENEIMENRGLVNGDEVDTCEIFSDEQPEEVVEGIMTENALNVFDTDEQGMRAVMVRLQAEENPSEEVLEAFYQVSEKFLQDCIQISVRKLWRKFPKYFNYINQKKYNKEESCEEYIHNNYLSSAWNGLCEAAKRFDLTQENAKFKPYAYSYINYEVRKQWESQYEFDHVNDSEHRYSIVSFEEPAPHKADTNVAKEHMDMEASKMAKEEGSWTGRTYLDEIEDTICEAETYDELYGALDNLTPTVKYVVEKCYGVQEDKASRRSVAKELGLPEYVVSGLLEAGKSQLREELAA